MKFDICIGNPPYGMDKKGSNKMLHWQIYKTVRDFCPNGKINIVCPMKWHINSNPCFDWVRKDMWEHLASFEFVKSEYFKGPQMDDPAIQYIDMSLTHNKCNLEKFFDIDGNEIIMKKNMDPIDEKIYDILDGFEVIYKNRFIRIDRGELVKKYSGDDLIEKIKTYFDKKGYTHYVFAVRAPDKNGSIISNEGYKKGIISYDDAVSSVYTGTNSKYLFIGGTEKYLLNILEILKNTELSKYCILLNSATRGVGQKELSLIPDINYAEIVSKVIEYTESNSSIDKSRISTESGLATDYALLWYMIYKKGLQDKYNNDDVNEILDYVNGGVKPSKSEDSSPSGSEQSKTVLDN